MGKTDFWEQVSEEYNCRLPLRSLSPFDFGGWPVAVRRKDMAEKIATIIIDSGASIANAVHLINKMAHLYSDCLLGEYLYPVKERKEGIPHNTIAYSDSKAKAIQEIIQLITDNNLSWAEVRGALWEAGLILLHRPLEGKQADNSNNEDK